MKRIFNNSQIILNPLSIRYNYINSKFNKSEPYPPPSVVSKHNLFNNKKFGQIINILKNPDNPYPKNAAYYHAIFEYILDESINNQKVMLQYGDTIHYFLQDIMERIKIMGAKELSDILTLLRFRPKALRFQKQLLLTIHLRFQTRIKQLIQLNENKKCSQQQTLTIQIIKNQVQGLFYLKKNTSILYQVLNFAYNLVYVNDHNSKNIQNAQQIKKDLNTFQEIIYIINENLDDTIDPIRESIVLFISKNYKSNRLIHNCQILRMIVKCKLYKNFPLVRNQYWIHQYIYSYLDKIVKQQNNIDIQILVSALKSSISYVMHVDPWSKNKFLKLIQSGYQMAKKGLLGISYINDKNQLLKQINTISLQIKLIPSYLYIKNQHKINTIIHTQGNKVNSDYIKCVIQQIKPIIKKFILCYFQKNQYINIDNKQAFTLNRSIQQNIKVLNNLIKQHQEPQKLLLKSVQNLLNTVTVFKDYNLIEVDTDFVLLLIQTQVIYCVLCRQWITDQVRFLRLLEHSVYIIGQLQKNILNEPQKYKKYSQKLKIIRSKMQQQLSVYDNIQKSYKQFTVLRLVSILKSMNIQPKYLGDYYRNVKLKKPNIYVQTLSRTMLRVNNYYQVIEAFQLMFQGKIPVKQIQLGRIVFLSSKQSLLLKYWLYTNREQFINKICFCRKIITNIVSIIRMDNLQINRNSIQILSQIVIQNKLYQLQNHSISNSQQESHQLKKIMCNNFSILFRYSKMDSMLDDIFIVNKNVPTLFRNKFSHIQAIKILSFASYLSEEQSIFYINRQNKNALFKFVIMLMNKVPYHQNKKSHYLININFHTQELILNVVGKIIQQYWPDNKMTNKAMPFYAEFLSFYTKINKFSQLINNQNAIFLIIKQIIQDYKLMASRQQFKYIISRIQNNYERLHFLSVFENETNINNSLQNVMNSMNFVLDTNVFKDLIIVIQKMIKQQIDKQQNKTATNDKKQLLFENYWLNKHLVNKLIINKLSSIEELDNYQDYQILSLLSVEIFVYGIRQQANQNMKIIFKKLLKIDPNNMNLKQSNQQILIKKGIIKQYPFVMFKILLSNLNIYLQNRQKRIQTGKQLIDDQISTQKITQWAVRCSLSYCKSITNNQDLLQIMHFLNNWNVDILRLIETKQLDIKHNLSNLASAYYDVQILSILLNQNIVHYNQSIISNSQNGTDLNKANLQNINEFRNQNILKYIKTLLKQFQQTYLMNNYGIYFQEQGQKIINIIKTHLLMILQSQSKTTNLYKQTNQTLKVLRQLFQNYNKVVNKTIKYNKIHTGGKYSYLYNKDQGNVVDIHQKVYKKNKNPYNQQSPDISSINIQNLSYFSQILQIIRKIKINKWSVSNFNQQHQNFMNQINQQITKNQNYLFNHSELTYFANINNESTNSSLSNEKLIEQTQFKQLNLKLLTKNHNKKLIIYYLVNPNTSILYDYQQNKRNRLSGQEQVIINYLQNIITISSDLQGNNSNSIQIKYLPYNLSKIELKNILTSN